QGPKWRVEPSLDDEVAKGLLCPNPRIDTTFHDVRSWRGVRRDGKRNRSVPNTGLAGVGGGVGVGDLDAVLLQDPHLIDIKRFRRVGGQNRILKRHSDLPTSFDGMGVYSCSTYVDDCFWSDVANRGGRLPALLGSARCRSLRSGGFRIRRLI